MNKTKIMVFVMALLMCVALSAMAFADGPQGGPPQNSMKMGENVPGSFSQNMPQGGFDQNMPQGGFDQNMPQGDFDQNMPQGNFDQNAILNVGRQNVPMENNENDPVNQILTAVSGLEDEDVKANLESLMQAHLDAMEAERNAEDGEARAEAAEAVAAAQEALDEALAEAGIAITYGQEGQEPPEKPENDEQPLRPEGEKPDTDGQEPPEKPEENEQAPEMTQQERTRMQQLFEQFLEWLKGNNEEDA